MKKAVLAILVILFSILAVFIAYREIQDWRHQNYLNSLKTPAQIDEGINYILDRYNVKGASVAVIQDFHVLWAKGYGITDAENPVPVSKNTLFDVASISKPVSAVAIIRVLHAKEISIDTEANDLLTSWQIKENQFTDSVNVTVRHLLSHRGGINVDGYRGYIAQDTLPTLLHVLNGIPPAENPKVEVIQTPGQSFMYSGGGYYILQQLLADVTEKSFQTALKNKLFDIIGMNNSTFRQDSLENYYESVASGHYKGTLIKIKRMQFAGLAAAGLKSTAGDLATFLSEIQRALQGKSARLLDQESAKKLIFPESEKYGLGFMLNGDFFGHGGANVGFLSTMAAHVEKGYGIVVLTNSSRDDNLISLASDQSRREIIDLISRIYNWKTLPNF
ncbi:beta-lactamase family protein [Aliifodinibius sp. S!AR15-10]|uniref:serine hydrolase domain-containing protein n=1 Tax=Aliifodinibius sp. S!AR15-10 TaxID=2950437 RepID=UPI00285F9126|nr:serine hydrolase domain-containing protein [Aliifodinibius sp. S!AR15-10]MDR8394584.1 beta-lactamase family protein [Aliifodinibius sp. S!AR15-10]